MTWQPRTTLKEIAKKTNLSVAAVSMALRDNPSLPQATIARVKRAAQKLNYTPNPAASALAAHRQRIRVHRDFSVIALVSNWSRRDEWVRRESAKQLLAGATARARAYGYELQHLWAREGGMSPARFNRVLQARGIHGVIVAPLEDPEDRFELAWNEFSVVTIERFARYAQFHHIVPNYYADLRLAWSKLSERGYHRIGLVIESGLAERVAHQWEAAHAYAQAAATPETDRVPTLVVGPRDPRGQVQRWIELHRPDGIICRSHDVLATLDTMKLRLPEDIAYVSLNVIDDLPHASGIQQHRDVMGATAVDVLHSLLHRNHCGPNPVSQGTHVDGSWYEGRTIAKQCPTSRGR
ncbi:MAG TPA: LacI family DNA-binding transcriptional regulator [Opitutaceae bacterium]|nr:LacI family DNA-binding transcriptional regulator [Opitutaceae bacterium]